MICVKCLQLMNYLFEDLTCTRSCLQRLVFVTGAVRLGGEARLAGDDRMNTLNKSFYSKSLGGTKICNLVGLLRAQFLSISVSN